MTELEILNKTVNTLNESTGSPLLFIGSGFSRRYCGLPKWDELLEIFCKDTEEFEKLTASSSGQLPELATSLAHIYHDRWWDSEDFKQKREIFKDKSNGVKLKNKTSALRWEICQYLEGITNNKPFQLEEEIDFLRSINIDGIITTNWDNLLEDIFPKYEVYVGQEDLLFSDTQSIGEIYKIHGCASDIDSLVLTKEDYDNFHRLNPYLAAKLITIFVEHPIVFIGYSMNDKNITSLLSSIVNVRDQSKLEKLSKNLIFLQRSNGEESSFTTLTKQFGSRSIPTTLIKTDNFKIVYEAVSKFEKKIPVRLIRLYKQQFYEIVSSSQPSKRMYVINESEIDENSNIQVVLGLSVATEAASKIGYTGINIQNLFEDMLVDSCYQSELVLSDTIPILPAQAKYVPIFKHLKKAGIKSKSDLDKSPYRIPPNKLPTDGASFYQTLSYQAKFQRDAKKLTTSEIISSYDPEKAAYLLPFQQKSKFKSEIVRDFLLKNKEALMSKSNKSTPFRKLVCYLDWVENGFHF